jgi:hypothetical protein
MMTIWQDGIWIEGMICSQFIEFILSIQNALKFNFMNESGKINI